MIYKPDQRPGSYVIITCGNHIYIVPVDFPCISRIGGFSIDGFHNIIWPVKRLIPDQLDLHRSVPKLFHDENGHILLFITVQGCAEDYGMNIPVHIV
jgi:hypothetical protein